MVLVIFPDTINFQVRFVMFLSWVHASHPYVVVANSNVRIILNFILFTMSFNVCQQNGCQQRHDSIYVTAVSYDSEKKQS